MLERSDRLSEARWFAGYELEELVHENQLSLVYKAELRSGTSTIRSPSWRLRARPGQAATRAP